MTRAEMGRTPHTVLPDFRVILPDGSLWIWDDRFNWWAMFRGPDERIRAAAARDVPPGR